MLKEKLAILGAGSGLGSAFVQVARSQAPEAELFLTSRKSERVFDFAKIKDQDRLLLELAEYSPTRLFYFAGGGPYGGFADKQWKDHLWAWEVSFVFPARVLHWAMSGSRPPGQLVMVGSAIAESKPDPMAASYAAAKHGLVGLHGSVVGELPKLDFRLYSPGYMDTGMLPPNAHPRHSATKILNPKEVAADLWQWSLGGKKYEHRIYH